MTEKMNDILNAAATLNKKSRKDMYQRGKVNLKAEWAARHLDIHGNSQNQK